MDAHYYPNLTALLANVQEEFAKGDYPSILDCFNAYIRRRKYWPMVQTKNFFGSPGLMLLHNTYTRTDVDHFQDLYDEIRSVVLDWNAPAGENIVVCFADKTPERLIPEQYLPKQHPNDTFHECFEGTMVYVYNYNDTWYFSTSTCPNVNSSKYFHPTKTHGEMFDEALGTTREAFTNTLNPDYTYGFLLVHHENRHLMDYTDLLGENYKTLYHMFTRTKKSAQPVDTDLNLPKPTSFNTFDQAYDALTSQNLYGVLVRNPETKLLARISTPEMFAVEKENLGNSNPWVNMLHVYMQQNPNFKIKDYLTKYQPTKSFTLYNHKQQEFAPVYIIHTVMMTLRDILHQAYHFTTNYDPLTKRYQVEQDFDNQYPAIIRFHLAQLRQLQITKHRHAPLSQLFIYHYLCLHQTMKNIRMLIHHIAQQDYVLSSRTKDCFELLSAELNA